jgi:hypothetical protein
MLRARNHFANDVTPKKPPPKGILWLASYPKSGNTWTRLFLHNLFRILEGDTGVQEINKLNEFTTWDLSAKSYEAVIGRRPIDVERSEIAQARPQVQASIAANTDGIALVKTHHALVIDRGVSTINTAITTGAVYIVRNPLDVAVSFAAHMGRDVDAAIEQMATDNLETDVTEKSVYEVYGSWSQHVGSWTRKPHRALHVMRYEDMLERPLETFHGLATHLLLRPTAAQLTDAVTRSSFEKIQKQEAEEGFREKPDAAERFFRAGRQGQWREQLSRRQIRRIVQQHSEQMRRFGYLTADLEHLA